MPAMKAADAKKLSETELATEVANLRTKLFELKSKPASAEKANSPAELAIIRRDIARLLTEKRLRELKKDSQ